MFPCELSQPVFFGARVLVRIIGFLYVCRGEKEGGEETLPVASVKWIPRLLTYFPRDYQPVFPQCLCLLPIFPVLLEGKKEERDCFLEDVDAGAQNSRREPLSTG